MLKMRLVLISTACSEKYIYTCVWWVLFAFRIAASLKICQHRLNYLFWAVPWIYRFYFLQYLEGSFLGPAGHLHPAVPFTTICVSSVFLFVSHWSFILVNIIILLFRVRCVLKVSMIANKFHCSVYLWRLSSCLWLGLLKLVTKQHYSVISHCIMSSHCPEGV